jgi:predicted phosphohydrolase
MNAWGISDLHLSFARPDRRERFAARWRDHAGRIEEHWRARVQPGDLVLIPGDISMARNHRDLQPDLAWLNRLPGTKVLSPGNHDQWWNGAEQIRPMLRASLRAVDGDAIACEGVVVCGAAGAPATLERNSPEESKALESLTLALESALRLRTRRETPLYVLWHYPPFDAHGVPGPCVEKLEEAEVTACVYGHLHSAKEWSAAVHGPRGSVRYYCVAADAIGFCPLRIDQVRGG